MRRERSSIGSARSSNHTDEDFGIDRDPNPDDDADGSNSIRILPDGTKVSANIFRRIKSLGLHSDLGGYVSSHRRSRSDDQFDRLDSSRSAASRNSRSYNAVTFIESDSEIELGSRDLKVLGVENEDPDNRARKEPSPQPSFSNLFGANDNDNISSSEEDEPAFSPKYSEWLTPPNFPQLIYPEPSNSQEPNSDLGSEVVEVLSPLCENLDGIDPAAQKLDFPSSRNTSSEHSGGPSSSNEEPTNVTRLGSETEQLRLDAYLKRKEEEERMKQRKREKPKLLPKSPRFTRETDDTLPQPLDFNELDPDEEDMSFTPVNVNWSDSGFPSDSKKKEPKREDVQREPEPPEKNVKRGVQLSQSSLASERVSIEDPPRRRQLKPSTSTTKIQRSGSFLKRSKSKLSLSRSYRKVRLSDTSKIASTRATAIQHDLSSGFNVSESKRTTFVAKGRAQEALDLVAATCQRHLDFAVWKRHNGYKLRVEGTYSGLKLRLSLFFEEIGLERRTVTMVDVRPSRKDRGGNKNLSGLQGFFKTLVTQLDIEGHIESSH